VSDGGYITEVAYPDLCHPFMAPVWLNYVAARNGYVPRPLDPGFTYLDLGCGLALTATTLAASYPQGRFFGVDINAAHIGPAKARAQECGVGNLELIEGDFAALPDDRIPPLDFAVLHGFYSWVGPAVRDQAVEFLARKVKPGGLVLASYNALPGWASIEPLRRLMRAFTASVQGSVLEKAMAARRWLAELKVEDIAFLENHPSARREIQAMQAQDIRYFVHEYFHRDWGLFYVDQVARDFARAGLAFAGSLPTGFNDPMIALPEALRGVAASGSRIAAEQLKDFANDERLRIDVFVRSDEAPLSGSLRADAYAGLAFGTIQPAPDPEIDIEVGRRKLRIDHRAEPGPRALFEGLAERPMTDEALRRVPGAPSQRAEFLAALDSLLDGGQFRPFATTAPALGPAPERVVASNAFNRRLLDAGSSWREAVLASPVVGDGVPLDGFAVIALRAYVEAGRRGAAERAARLFEATGESLRRDGAAVPASEAAQAIADETERFLERVAPRLLQLDVIRPA
jgi:SAM-dependent methyltransferase